MWKQTIGDTVSACMYVHVFAENDFKCYLLTVSMNIMIWSTEWAERNQELDLCWGYEDDYNYDIDRW